MEFGPLRDWSLTRITPLPSRVAQLATHIRLSGWVASERLVDERHGAKRIGIEVAEVILVLLCVN